MFPNPLYHAPITDGTRWLLESLPTYQTWFRFRLFWLYGDFNYPALWRDPAWPHPERSVNAVNDKIRRLLARHIEREIGDDVELLAKVVPDYPPFTKRMLIDNHWYRTLQRSDVDLVTEPIDRIVPGGIVTADGVTHPADIVALATGFETTTMLAPLNISSTSAGPLNDRWRDDPRAYLGITVPGYPNLFCLYGPNTNLGHGGSAFFQTECQMRYIIGCLRLMVERGWQTIDCRPEVHDAYNARVDATHEQLVWTHPGAGNWFRNAAGRVTTNCPWRMIDYWQMTRIPDPADYRVCPHPADA
jgi:4-hydroxyacetophenone monooxygenase